MEAGGKVELIKKNVYLPSQRLLHVYASSMVAQSVRPLCALRSVVIVVIACFVDYPLLVAC